MRRLLTLTISAAIAASIGLTGCADDNKKTRKITVEGPKKKTEIKVETTEKK